MSDIIVIGSGAAGMMAACKAAELGAGVRILEKNEKAGKKIYITGKGRCNVTNACDVDFFIKNILSNQRFMFSSLKAFDTDAVMSFLEENGCPVKVERGNRVFPVSDHASDVTKAFELCLKRLGVKTEFNTTVDHIEKIENTDGTYKFSVSATDNKSSKKAVYSADKVIIATGGLSYPSTGSTGDGYKFAKSFGIKVTDTFPSLTEVFFSSNEADSFGKVELKNTGLKLRINKKDVYEDIGELEFTKNGITGPLALTSSAYIAKAYKDNGKNNNDIRIIIDLKPGLSEEQLDKRVLRDFENFLNLDIYNGLSKLLISGVRSMVLKRAGIDIKKKIRDITKEERCRLVFTIKNMEFQVLDIGGFTEAVITSGGVDVKELDPKTMESKKVPGLFFAGEVIDIDCFTGGFNLQVAWSTGTAAGTHAAY